MMGGGARLLWSAEVPTQPTGMSLARRFEVRGVERLVIPGVPVGLERLAPLPVGRLILEP